MHVSVPCGGGTPVQAEILFVTICLKQSCYELLLRPLRLAPQKLLLISTLCVVSFFSSVLCGTNTWASLHYTHLLSLSLKPAPTNARVFRNEDIVVLFNVNIKEVILFPGKLRPPPSLYTIYVPVSGRLLVQKVNV